MIRQYALFHAAKQEVVFEGGKPILIEHEYGSPPPALPPGYDSQHVWAQLVDGSARLQGQPNVAIVRRGWAIKPKAK